MLLRIVKLCLLFIGIPCALLFAQNSALRFEDYSKIYGVTNAQGRTSYNLFLVELKSSTKKSELVNLGITIKKTLSESIAIIETSTPPAEDLFNKKIPANNLYKLQTSLLNSSKEAEELLIIKCKSKAQLNFKLFHSLQLVKNIKNGYVVRATTKAIIEELINNPEVLYVGKESLTPSVESKVLDLNLEPNAVTKVHDAYPNLTGKDITISIKELSYKKTDIDIIGRTKDSPIAATSEDSHATDMATIIAGAGNSFVTGRGVAKGATVTSSAFTNLFADDDTDYTSLDVSIQNHSYGTVIENSYGSLAESFDISTNSNPSLLHIFSSGNQGATTTTTGNYAGISGYANLTGNFKMAKNILVVGSVDTVNRLLPFSSKGPTYDGRLKPEVVAYGVAGTSNAAALVSGIASLLQQLYVDKFSALPPSTLIKSALITSAEDVDNAGPDFKTGYGNVNAYRAHTIIQDEKFICESISNGESKDYQITIPSNTAMLKLSLVWNDPAAPVDAAIALVNDLDLKITDPNTTIYTPWVLNAGPSNLAELATRGVDHLNNSELISINNPAAGTYTITISGYDVPDGPQSFCVTYNWSLDDSFEWYYPTGSDNFPYNGETATYFRWKTSIIETGRLEYSIDNGSNWILISDNIDLQKGYFRWIAPELHTAAIARMVINGTPYQTNVFTISKPVGAKIGFNCGDSLLLMWSKVSEAAQYQVSSLDGSYMQSFQMTSDTSLIINKNLFASPYFNITPVLSNGKNLIVSNTIDYSIQNIECYLTSFVADLEPNIGIRLSLMVGTTYGIDNVIFERKSDDTFQSIGIMNATDNTISILDTSPQQGFNRYRVRIQFINGEEIISEEVESYFLSKIPFMIFPNPATINSDLSIISKPFSSQDKTLRLVRTDGVEVFKKYLVEEYEVISLHSVTPGLYIYIIETVEGSFKGKLLIK